MSEYVLGSSDREIERLAYQHEVWSVDTSSLWKKAEIGIGSRVADLGCGPGFCSEALARIVGNEGHVHAIDMSEKFSVLMTEKVKSFSNMTFRRKDAAKTDIPSKDVDVVFSRWLYSFLSDPDQAIIEAKRILKPGGRFVAFDYFSYLSCDVFPVNESISGVFEAFAEDVERHGGSWEAGGKLPSLLAQRGFEIESLDPICRIGRPGSREWNWVEYFIEVTTPRLVETGIWSEERKQDFEKAWSESKARPGSFVFTPPMIGIIARLV